MREDVKKKFLDILFETESDDEPAISNDYKERSQRSSVKNVQGSKTVLAKDILYSKGNENTNTTSFINLDEKPQVNFEPVKKKPLYSPSENLSPMFGVLNSHTNEIEDNISRETKPVIKRNETSILGTIISPIFGTDVRNDFSNTMSLSIHKVEKVQENLMDEIKNEKKKPKYDNSFDLLSNSEKSILDDTSELKLKIAKKEQEALKTQQFRNEVKKSDGVFKDVFQELNENTQEIKKSPKAENFKKYEEVKIPDETFADLVEDKKMSREPIYSFNGHQDYDVSDVDLSKFKEHSGDTEEIDLMKDLFNEEF